MENASKALIVAGAVLLSILIIALGMYIYNSSTTSVYVAGDQIEAQELEVANSQWTTFEGFQSGTSVKSMISKLILNSGKNDKEKTKLPDLVIRPTAGDTRNFLAASNTNELNVVGFNAARTLMEKGHDYFVEVHFCSDTGYVDLIRVHYDKPANLPTIEGHSYFDVEGIKGLVDFDESMLSPDAGAGCD